MTVMRRGRSWSFVVWVPDGVGRHQVWRGGYRTKAEAAAAERRFLVELDDEGDRAVAGVGPTVREFLTEWLVQSEPTRRATTSVSYERCVRDHVVPQLGDVVLRELAPDHVRAWQSALLHKTLRFRDGTLSPTTVRYCHRLLRRALQDVYKLCIIDDGIGMTGEEMIEYINQLSSSVHLQTHEGNFGVGAKIAAATRNHEGLIYLSWKNAIGYMTHLWRDPDSGDYGMRQLQRPDGSFDHWARVEDTLKPRDGLQLEAHGTKVVLLGNSPDADTMQAPQGAASPSRWIARYLNTRYFRFPEGITVRAREGWENPRADKDRNLLRTLTGQEKYLDDHAQSSGEVDLLSARARWWILRDELALTQNSGSIASSGHMAALYQDELYEMVSGRAGVARLQMFGVIFGYQRVVIYLEPQATAEERVSANTSRTNLLINNEPLPWADWAAEFRNNMPVEIVALMEEITAGTRSTDHRQAIRERLRQIRDLLRLSRFRPTPRGDKVVENESVAGGRSGRDNEESRESRGGSRSGGGRAGNAYALFLAGEDGVLANEVFPDVQPEVTWISVEDGTRAPGFLEDRAATYLLDQNLLQINGDFRVFADMIDRWCEFYAHVPGARPEITEACREWFEQSLIETVLGVQTLKGSKEWTVEDIKLSLGEEALTAAVMQRYHVDVAVRRALGAKLGTLKDRAS